jgi:hypothetical protein
LKPPYSPKLAPNIKYIYPHRGNIYFYPRASPSPLFAPTLPTICPSIAPRIRNIGGVVKKYRFPVEKGVFKKKFIYIF